MDRADDPRARSSKYSKEGFFSKTKGVEEPLDFALTQFVIDDNYVGDPPSVQVSIQNLNDNIDENFLKKDLTKLGRIRTLEIIRNPKNGQHLGLAKVQFEDVSVAQACVDNFNGKHIMGRQLCVFKDIRFAIIEKIKESQLNPRPQIPLPKQPQIQQPPPPPPPLLPNIASITTPTPSLPTANIYNAHLSAPQSNAIHLPKPNSLGPTPSPISIDYASTTPGSITTSATMTPESVGRQRLEDRIAILMKRPDCVLSAIVAPAAPQASPTYSAFNIKDVNYEYSNSSFNHQAASMSARIPDKMRRPDINDHRRDSRSDYSNHSSHINNQNHKDAHQKYDTKNDHKTDRYSNNKHSDDDWDSYKKQKEPLNIELSEEQIENEVLPFCYREFYHELTDNLITTILKKLREKHGYQCLERAQTEYKAYCDKKKIKAEIERIKREEQLQYERRYMSREKVEQPIEAPRPKVHLQRTATIQDSRRRGETDLRRVNRSSAYMVEPERRGSHASIDSDFSDSESSASAFSSTSSSSASDSSSSSSSSSRGSRSSSRSSSRSRSRSSSAISRSPSSCSDLSMAEEHGKKSSVSHLMKDQKSNDLSSRQNEHTATSRGAQGTIGQSNSENEAIEALLNLQYSSSDNKVNDSVGKSRVLTFPNEDDDEVVKKPPKAVNKKRKNKVNDVLSVASEYRAAKRFASNQLKSHDENIENAVCSEENLIEDKPEAKFIYPERSDEEKRRMLDDLFGTLNEEDIKYLAQVHAEAEQNKDRSKVAIPFGSEMANKIHLNMKKHMIEGKAAEGHPKWWRGCSRCDVIKVSDKGKTENEEVNFEDLTRAPIKSHVIQIATSSRRDQRGDQRRMAVMNANIDADYLKCYQTSTLQVIIITSCFSAYNFYLLISTSDSPYRCVLRISDFLGVKYTNGVCSLAKR